jgi:hypothetical protein
MALKRMDDDGIVVDLELTLGNPGRVDLIVNGRPVAAGSPSEVAHLAARRYSWTSPDVVCIRIGSSRSTPSVSDVSRIRSSSLSG